MDGGVVYLMNRNGEICSYDSTTCSEKWSELPKYPYKGGNLAVINGDLTGIGGQEDFFTKSCGDTNKLLKLKGSWIDILRPMPTKRHSTTAITTKEHLIVAGGATGPFSDADTLSTVEVMNTKTLVWSTVASLPHPCRNASVAICGDHLYMLGGSDKKGDTKSVFTCSLSELLQSSSSSSSVWHGVADAPTYHSACAAVNTGLLAVGGWNKDHVKMEAAIHKYNQKTASWDVISNMPTTRWHCRVAVLPTKEIMVIGMTIYGCETGYVEIASLN